MIVSFLTKYTHPNESSFLSKDLSRLLLVFFFWVTFDMAKDGATGVFYFDYNILHISYVPE